MVVQYTTRDALVLRQPCTPKSGSQALVTYSVWHTINVCFSFDTRTSNPLEYEHMLISNSQFPHDKSESVAVSPQFTIHSSSFTVRNAKVTTKN